MKLFDIFQKFTKPRELPKVVVPRELQKIGVSDSVCPYCNNVLDKKPARKKKCPHCDNFIYVRTRPQDKAKVLVTERQAEQIDEQWSIANGTHGAYLAEKNKIANEHSRLAKKFGKEPSANDVKWGILTKEVLDHASDGDWGLYRNAHFQMAEVLRKESKLKQALSLYCRVCYLDINGPRNTSGLKSRKYPSFSPKEAFLAPGVISLVERTAEKMKLNQDEIKSVFMEIAEREHKGLKLPVSPEKAWGKMKKELFQ